jgi:hypothetical protein
MVQWKGNIRREEAGDKAANLESLERFDVPNFFVLTKSEVKEFLDSRDPERISNNQLSGELVEAVKEAYRDIGMSSEVRNSTGRARNLVGNQRESQRVSIRVSENENNAEYKLNIGASDLEQALREVLTSYFRENSETPAVIFQKMIEPEYSGAVINNYTRRHSLVEMVEGLGHSLEEGITVPEFYLLEENSVIDTRAPDKQVKVSRNPMNGQRRTRRVSNSSSAFQNSEIEDLREKSSREDLGVKFVYKRGSFYAVDAFENRPLNVEPDLSALKVSEGEIEGREGRDYVHSDETQGADRPLVAEKGGFTSTHSQRMRRKNLPAVVSLENPDELHNSGKDAGERSNEDRNASTSTDISSVTATEIRTLEEFPQLSENPFSFQESEQKFAETCEEILSDEPEFIDGRSIEEKALYRCLDLVDQVRILAVETVSEEVVDKVLENSVEVLAVPRDLREEAEKRILRQEKRFMLENLRD